MYNKNAGINNFANQKQGGENMSKELFVRAEEADPGDAGDFDAEETIGPDRGCRARNHHVRHRMQVV